MKRPITVALVAVLALAAPSEAQFFGSAIVFDPQNFAQNLLTATRELEQINNQIRQLQNQALMLQNMGKNLSALNSSQLGTMVASLTQVSSLMNQGSGIAFNLNATDTAFARTYPQTYAATTTDTTLLGDAHQRWQDAMAAFLQALQVQSQIAGNVQSDSATLGTLIDASQGAEGNLQVQQAGNQLLALSIKQQLQIQSLIAAQGRATALDEARESEAEEEGRASFQDFLGTDNAYTPQ